MLITIRFLPCFALGLMACAFGVGCNRTGPDKKRPRDDARGNEPSSVTQAEPWTNKSPTEWPQIVLTNQADFNGHTSLHGASAFLVQTRDGRTLAATAKHLLGANGGVDPEIPVARLGGVIRSWLLYPRTMAEQAVNVDGLGAEGLDDENMDWLILTIKSPSSPLPAAPLRLRASPVQVGEQVFLVGCPYAEPACKQNVYKGRVTARVGDRFRYDIEPPVDIRGFSGAPVLDGAGHVVGVMTVWFDPKMQEEKFLEAGGEDAATVYRLIEREQ